MGSIRSDSGFDDSSSSGDQESENEGEEDEIVSPLSRHISDDSGASNQRLNFQKTLVYSKVKKVKVDRQESPPCPPTFKKDPVAKGMRKCIRKSLKVAEPVNIFQTAKVQNNNQLKLMRLGLKRRESDVQSTYTGSQKNKIELKGLAARFFDADDAIITSDFSSDSGGTDLERVASNDFRFDVDDDLSSCSSSGQGFRRQSTKKSRLTNNDENELDQIVMTGHQIYARRSTKKSKKPIERSQSVEVELRSRQVIQTPLTVQGLFSILMAANMYLQNDFEICYDISGPDQHPVAVSQLFLGNIGRFRSLSCLKLFQHAVDEGYFLDNFGFLVDAITSIQKSLTIYQTNDELSGHPNYHGMALCSYQLGFIYENFADKLSHPKLSEALCDEYLEYTLGSTFQSLCLAHNHYSDAGDYFGKVNHLKGLELSLRKTAHVMAVDEDDQEQVAERRELLKKADKFETEFKLYCVNVGIENSCHVRREHGDEISIMTEIVFKWQISNVFPPRGEDHLAETPLIPLGQMRKLSSSIGSETNSFGFGQQNINMLQENMVKIQSQISESLAEDDDATGNGTGSKRKRSIKRVKSVSYNVTSELKTRLEDEK